MTATFTDDIATATGLVQAVVDRDHVEIGYILGRLNERELRDLCVRLAGHVNIDLPLTVHPLSMDRVLESCIRQAAHRFGTTTNVIRSESRKRHIIDARHVAIYAARLCGASYPLIGKAICRDHTTAMHACGRIGETPRLRLIAQQIAESVGRADIEGED